MEFYRFALTLALAAPPGARGAALSTQWSLTSGDCPSDCHNRGACRGGRCYCVAGWGGKACDVKQCSVCAHGKCIDGECVCDAGFMGRQCRERTAPLAALAPNMGVGIQISTVRGSGNYQRHRPFGSCLSERAPASETPKRGALRLCGGGRRLTAGGR